MSQLEYKKLEDKFIELSDDPRLEYQEADWMAVEQMLNKDDKDRSPILFLLWGLLGTIVTAGLFYFAGSFSDDSPLASASTPEISNERMARDNINSVGTDIETSLISTNQQKLNNENLQNDPTIQADLNPNQDQQELNNNLYNESRHARPEHINSSVIVQDAIPRYDNVRRSINQSEDFIQSPEPLLSVDQTSNNLNTEHLNRIQIDAIESNNDILHNSDQALDSQQAAHVAEHKTSSLNNTTGELDHTQRIDNVSNITALLIAPLDLATRSLSKELTLENKSEVLDEKKPKFLFNVNAGVEIAQSPLGGLSDTDYSFGFNFGYAASSKLVVNAGVNYIRECYLAEGGDYSPPVGFWSATEGVAPEEILALCDMIDVSLGASYHFTGVQNNGLMARVSLLSNFMLREEYDYRFAQNSDDFTGVFRGDSETFLSQVELATSYKWRTGAGYFLDAGPYLKLPLNGVGHGNVRLTSIGLRVGISLVK